MRPIELFPTPDIRFYRPVEGSLGAWVDGGGITTFKCIALWLVGTWLVPSTVTKAHSKVTMDNQSMMRGETEGRR